MITVPSTYCTFQIYSFYQQEENGHHGDLRLRATLFLLLGIILIIGRRIGRTGTEEWREDQVFLTRQIQCLQKENHSLEYELSLGPQHYFVHYYL